MNRKRKNTLGIQGWAKVFLFIIGPIALWTPSPSIFSQPSERNASQPSQAPQEGEFFLKEAVDNGLKYPANILLLDGIFSHHVAIAEKATHSLHLFQNDGGGPRYLKSYRVATGKTAGNKINQGDLKTPEGIYQLTSFLNQKQLLDRYGVDGKMYGAGAFVLNYPNVMDQRANKTGYGIWLHSTDDENRISKGLDSKGCVVVSDRDLKDISQYIDLENTSLIIVHELFFLRKQTWEANRDDLKDTIDHWLKAWQNENLDEYLSFYHPSEFNDPSRGSLSGFRSYKGAVFSRPGRPQIQLSNFSILSFNDYTVIQFQQDYLSDTINDSGKKTLFMKRDNNYRWKIVAESFAKLPHKSQVAFTPSMRFFNDKEI